MERAYRKECRSRHWVYLLLLEGNKMEVWMPATKKAKLVRQVLVQREKSFIQVLHDLGEWWTPV